MDHPTAAEQQTPATRPGDRGSDGVVDAQALGSSRRGQGARAWLLLPFRWDAVLPDGQHLGGQAESR